MFRLSTATECSGIRVLNKSNLYFPINSMTVKTPVKHTVTGFHCVFCCLLSLCLSVSDASYQRQMLWMFLDSSVECVRPWCVCVCVQCCVMCLGSGRVRVGLPAVERSWRKDTEHRGGTLWVTEGSSSFGAQSLKQINSTNRRGVAGTLEFNYISPHSLLTDTPLESVNAFPHKLDLVVKFYNC